MAILTCNADDFMALAESWYFAGREHSGIVLAPQFNSRPFGELLRQVLRFLNSLTADEVRNRVLFLQQFSGFD
jgi:hypothetical protein